MHPGGHCAATVAATAPSLAGYAAPSPPLAAPAAATATTAGATLHTAQTGINVINGISVHIFVVVFYSVLCSLSN